MVMTNSLCGLKLYEQWEGHNEYGDSQIDLELSFLCSTAIHCWAKVTIKNAFWMTFIKFDEFKHENVILLLLPVLLNRKTVKK